MPTPDDYQYDPGQRPYYTPAAYRPPPRDPRANVDPNATTYQPVPEGPATPGTGDPGARSGRNDYHGTPTPFTRRLLAAGAPMPTPDQLTAPPPSPPGPQVAAIPRPPLPPGVDPNRGYIFPPPTPREQPTVTPGTLTPPPQKQGDRYWNPVGQQQPFAEQINRYAHEYGVPPTLLSNLLRAESNFNPNATGPMTKYGQAGGIAQFIPQTAARYHINPYDPDQGIRGAANYLRDLYTEKGNWSDAVAAYNGSKSIDTSQYRGSPEGRALIANAVALDGGLVKAGPLVPPPQNYRPVSYTPRGGYPSMFPDRPPSMWGRDHPSMFEGPGAVPHEREIPGILQGLAPFLMIGLALFSKGAALPMLSAFAGYQTAKNQRRDKDAKELKTFYQDKLKETKAKLGLEQGDAAAAMAMPPGPERDEALQRIALEYGDSQLQAIVAQGGDPRALFQARDKAYQDISKTHAAELAERKEDLAERRQELAERHADHQEEYQNAMLELAQARGEDAHKAALDKAAAAKQKLEDDRKKQKALDDEAKKWGGGSTTSPAEDGKPDTDAPAPDTDAPAPESDTPAPAEPEPAPPSDSDTPGPGGAATPPAGATPASAEAAPTSEPPPTGGEDQVVDAQGNPVRPRSDIVPADYRGPTPQATPVADTSGGGATATPSPIDTKAAGMVMGDTNLTGIPKAQQDEIQLRAAKMQDALNQIPKNLTGEAVTNAVSRINPQMGDALGNLLNYTSGVPGEGATSGGQGGRMNPFWQRMEALAHQANPYWNPGQFHMYQKQREDFAGKGGYAVTLARSNRLLSASAKVLQAAQEIEKIQGFDANRLQAEIARFNSTGIVGDPEYAGLESAWRNFAIESTAVSQGAIPPVTTTKALMDVAPMGGTVRTIRNAVKTDLYSAIGAVETARQVWDQLPENQGRHSEPLGFIQQAYDGLNIIGNTLDLQTGAMSPTYTDENGEQHTVKMPAMLQAAQPQKAAPTAGWGATGAPQ